MGNEKKKNKKEISVPKFLCNFCFSVTEIYWAVTSQKLWKSFEFLFGLGNDGRIYCWVMGEGETW